MTPKEALDIVSEIKYKLEFRVDTITCDGIQLSFKVKPSPGTELFVNVDGNATVGTSRKIDITRLNELELLAVVYDMFAEFEVHECSEFFEYKGLKLFNSHDLKQEAKSDTLNIVAPRIQDIDLNYVKNHRRIEAEARKLYNSAYLKVNRLETMKLMERIIFLFTGEIN